MYISLSSWFEYEREGCPCRLNGGFTGGSATWPYGMRKFRVLQGPSELFDASTIITMSLPVGTLRYGTTCSWKMVWLCLTQVEECVTGTGWRHSASYDSKFTEVAAVFRRHMQRSVVRPWWAHLMAREFPGLDASRLFRVGVRQVICIRTKTTEWGWLPTEDHRDLCTKSLRNCCAPRVWSVPRPPRRSCWVPMCWNTKVVSLLHMYVPLTGNKVDSFLQRFSLFLWHLKWITLYFQFFSSTNSGSKKK
jgi:hypothetical protein